MYGVPIWTSPAVSTSGSATFKSENILIIKQTQTFPGRFAAWKFNWAAWDSVYEKGLKLRELAQIVAKLDSAIHPINHYPVDKWSKFWITHGVQAFSDEWGKISAQAHTLICIHL